MDAIQEIKILLVEDHEISQRAVRMVITSLGCFCDVASTGVKALELFQQNNYDLIFMDIGLPDHNGLEIAARMRQSAAEIPIVILSAYSDDNYRNQAQSIPVNYFTVKPMTLEICDKLLKEFVFKKKCNVVSRKYKRKVVGCTTD